MQSTFLSAVVAAVATAVPAWPSPPSYVATDLGQVIAYAINNSGDVVGRVCLPEQVCNSTVLANWRAFLYHNGMLNMIDSVPSVATGINDSGQVVGYDIDPRRWIPAAVFLYSGGVLTSLPLPAAGGDGGDPAFFPILINSSGDIAATVFARYCAGGGGRGPATLIYHNGTVTCLPLVGFTVAFGFNDSGVVVGIKSEDEPFIYSDGVMRGIGRISDGSARAVNNSGQVVGVDFAGPGFGAFLYSNGIVTDLNALGGFTNSRAFAINSTGAVVGSADRFGAFLYADGVFTNLNTLLVNDIGTTLYSANGINDSGQIIAAGANGHAYLLTPAF